MTEHTTVTLLKPSTGLSLGLIAATLVPMGGFFAWMESTYVHKDTYSLEIRHMTQTLEEIKEELKELRR